MKRFLSFRFFAKLVAGLVVLGLVVVAVENWTGTRALAKAREVYVQEGETLDFAALRPQSIPTEQNFLAIEPLAGISSPQTDPESPLHQTLRSVDWMAASYGKSPKAPRPNLNRGCVLGEVFDPASTATYLKEVSYIDTPPNAGPAQVLEAIDRMHPLLKQLSDAVVERSDARFDPAVEHGYDGAPYKRPSPKLNGAIEAAKGLALRAQFATASGDADSAVCSIRASTRFTQALSREPLLIRLYAATTTSAYEANSIWFMLNQRKSVGGALAMLQLDLERLDFLRSLLQALRGELVWQMETIEWDKTHRDDGLSAMLQSIVLTGQSEPNWFVSTVIDLIPPGWFDHNAANTLQLGSEYLLKPVRDRDVLRMMRGFDELKRVLDAHRTMTSPHYFWTVLSFPSYRLIIEQVVYIEAMRRQSIAAIAIERYRLAHAKLPATLADLVPEFLPAVPQDPIDSASMRYRVERKETFALWSIGWDGKNDGGKRPDGKEARNVSREDYIGDWVWKN